MLVGMEALCLQWESLVNAKTMSVPAAGKEYFDLSRNGSYAAAARGEIPTIKIGKLLRVPVQALEQMLANPTKAA
jgi:hypothetical protein